MSVTYLEENKIGFIELDLADSKVNLLAFAVLKEFDAILDSLQARDDLQALVILSGKKDVFIAGADIKEIEDITEEDDGAQKSKAGQEILNKLEDLPFPTIAVIDGVTLGGGCELALACQYRLATFNDKVQIGLPEVNLGILPGFGGTYRLPRLIGLLDGMNMILQGKPVDGKKALRIGLVDKLVPQIGEENYILDFISEIEQGKVVPDKYKRRKFKGQTAFLNNTLMGNFLVFRGARKNVLKLTKGFYPAPLSAIDVVKKTFFIRDRAKGMAIEAKAFGKLAVTAVSKNLVKVFYLSEKYRKLTVDIPADIKPMDIRKCGVLGAGVMGGGIAQLLSFKGIWVRLKDIHYDALALGLKSAYKIFKQALKRRRIKKNDLTNMMARITPTLDYSGFGNADLVIEAVVENMDIKKKVFAELSSVTGAKTILATNTSALSITEMAAQTKDPSKVIGIHFFNPVHRMPLIEVITTPQTSKETLATALSFVKRLGKTPIIVKDSCGFLVNRILLGYINEAGRLLEEGGDIAAIDKIMTDFGMPMGPFTLSDEVGLDVGVKVLHILEEGLGERFKSVKGFDQILEKGFLGKKSGRGFYLYNKKRNTPNPGILKFFPRSSRRRFDAEQARKRMIYIMVNEAAKCLKEGIIDDPGAVDVGMIFGAGFPAFRGGLLRYADGIGISGVIEGLNRLEHKLDAERFSPSVYLSTLKKENKTFY